MSDPSQDPEGGVPRGAVRHVVVGAEDAGQRLDKVLARLLPDVPRSHLFRLLRRGEVRLNGGRARGEARVAEGDRLRLPPIRIAPAVPAGEERPKPVPRALVDRLESAIVREDDRLLVIDKPSGVAVHGGSGIGYGVIEALRASRPDETLELVHRLDRDTSGCLLVARKRSTLRDLHALLREESFDKRYLALLKGKWEFGQKLIDAPLRTDLRVGGERTVKVDPHGKAAASEFRVVQFYGRLATLVEVRLLTGRTHQIRVHAAFAGHPVAGDEKYGDPEFNAQMRELGLGRLFLHAHSVGYEDPGGRGPVSASSPLPAELTSFLDRLATAAAGGKLKPRGEVKPWTPARARPAQAAKAGQRAPKARAAPAARGKVRAAKTPRRGAPRRPR